MVEFLIQNDCDLTVITKGENQCPLHYAAKNDAINSIRMLLAYGADINARDHKNRTPLQVLELKYKTLSSRFLFWDSL